MRSHTPIIATLAVLFLSFVVFALPLNKTPFSSHGEAREAVVVTDMIEQHDLILPLRNGIDIPSKPPLFHWLALAASNMLGSPPNELSIRLPSAFAGAVTLALIFVVMATLYNSLAALLVVLVTMTSFEWARSSSLARVDMVFTACLTISFFLMHKIVTACITGKRPPSFSVFLLGLALGLATLSKGPAAVALAGIAGAIYFLCSWLTSDDRQRVCLPLAELIGAILIAFGVAGWWYYLAYLQGGEQFLAVQLMKENAARALGLEGYSIGHENPFYFSVVYLFLGFLPWSILLPLCAVVLWQRRAVLLTPKHSLLFFSLIWVGVFLSVITLSGSKRIVYFLPAYPALAIATVLSLSGASADFPATRWTKRTLQIVTVLFILLCALLTNLAVLLTYRYQSTIPQWLHLSARDKHNVEQILVLFRNQPLAIFGALLFSLILLFVAMRNLRSANIARSLLSLACAFLPLIAMVANCVYPLLAAQNSPQAFMTEVNKIVPNETPLFQFRENIYSAMFYAGRNLPLTASLAEAAPYKEVFVLTRDDLLPAALAALPSAKMVLQSSPRAAEGRGRLVLLHYQKESITQ